MILPILLCVALSQTYYSQDEAKQIFTSATQSYSQGDHSVAKDGFEKLATHGQGGPNVFFNLGTTYLAMNDLGHAILWLERAHAAAPSADDISTNLNIARGRQLDQVVGQGGGTFVERLVDSTSASLLAWCFLVPWVASFIFLILRRFSHRRRMLAVSSALCFAAAVIPGAAIAAHVYVRENYREAVVTAPVVQVRDLPSSTAKSTFEIHAGLKVRVIEESGDYERIHLPNALEGWIEKASIEEL